MSTPVIFNGSVPGNYEEFLTPFLFDPYAADLMERIDFTNAQNVLELACGTGCVTSQLIAHLSPTAQLTATDLQIDMLNIAKAKIENSNITWKTVDMTAISYDDEQFDLIVCQFGLMLVPEKLKALMEMYRVLRKGGKLIFNVWGPIEDNSVWKIAGEVLSAFLEINPILQAAGPFSMSKETDTLPLLEKAGFKNIKATTVKKEGKIETAAAAAQGFIQGLPVFMAITQKNPALVPQIIEALELELKAQLGDQPLRSLLSALVFEAEK